MASIRLDAATCVIAFIATGAMLFCPTHQKAHPN
jgi:hypothetical protein